MYRQKSFATLLTVLTLIQWINGISIQNMDNTDKVPNQYIIKLNTEELDFKDTALIEQKIENIKNKLTAVTDFKVLEKYDLGKVVFLLVECNIDTSVAYALDVPEISKMEADLIVKASDCVTQSGVPWSLSRISKRDMSLSFTYNYEESDGEDTVAYVFDSGIFLEHEDFGGRAESGYVRSFDVHGDFNGHGTHCTGTILSATYGVAKQAHAIAVKVLDEDGRGTVSNIIAGIGWTLDHYSTLCNTSTCKAVASMSLGSSNSFIFNEATQFLIDAGITVVVAAGNGAEDACTQSPASVKDAITVAASNVVDKLADYSNHGQCVDIIAPGTGVLSTWIGDISATYTASGTSMATPLVAGVILRRLSQVPGRPSPADLKEWLLNSTSIDRIDIKDTNTPNKLLYAPCDITENSYDSAMFMDSNRLLIFGNIFLVLRLALMSFI